jgi:tetratricopeptide (TPR) repeat protein
MIDAPRMADVSRARIRAKLVEDFGARGAGARRRSPALAIGAGLVAVAAAAAVAVVAGGGGAGFLTGGDKRGPVTAGSDGAIALEDGSTAIAAPGATVEVVGPRRVRVTGQVLLDVVPGQGQFVVDTAAGHVAVLGTRFAIDAEAGKTTAAVVRGEVRLESPDGEIADLHAGEEAISEPGKRILRAAAPRLSHLVSWAEQTRRHLESPEPVHHGTLYARQPNAPWAPEQPLPISKLGVDIVVQDRVARVAIDQTFHNDAAMDLEGMYRFAIPPDAALQRFAMYNDGKLTESAVVERMAARRAYEELVYRRVDPGLLEWQGTGKLAMRVYPLPAQQDKRLMVAYTQSLPQLYGDWTLTVPLPDVDVPVGDVAFDVTIARCASCEITSTSHKIEVARAGDDARVTYHASGAKLGDSLVLHVRDARGGAMVSDATDGGEHFVMVRAPAELGGASLAYKPRTWVIVDDVSASRDAFARRAQADVVDALLRELDENDRVAIVTFDVEARTKLAAMRVADVDRQAVRTALRDDDGGVGATDLGVALDAANQQLAGVAADDAMVVYLGDGVLTAGSQHLDELRGKLVGHAHFIGVGIGDGPDTQTLDALAGATAGYATTIDLSDDLGWRTFDLVAALHTARVTGVTAKLVDGSGKELLADAYLRSPQLADGEEIDLVAKLVGDQLPASVVLTGTRDGTPWTQSVAIDGSRHDAGYLPRLWAQRRVAELMLAKHEPVAAPECMPKMPCETTGELRDARDEVLRKQIVELGKRYFLLTRHTSLLVLENDDMYRRFGIAKGTGDTWAPYAMPAKIAVTHAPALDDAQLAEGTVLERMPVSAFADYGYNYAYSGSLGNGSYDGMPRHMALRRASMNNPLATDDFGGYATFGHGAGTGGGEAVAVTQTATTGDTKADDLGADVTASLDALDSGTEDREADRRIVAVDQAKTAGLDEGVMGKVEKKPSYKGGDSSTGSRGYYGGGRFTTRAAVDLEGDFHELEASGQSAAFAMFDGRDSLGGLDAPGAYGQLYLQRYLDRNDALYDDLTSVVPAFVAGDADDWHDAIGAAGPLQAIDPAAHDLLERARHALPAGVVQWNGADVAVDAAGHLAWTRTTAADLVERATFANGTWLRDYGELDLEVRRADVSELAVRLAAAPMWIAGDDVYRAHYAVRARGDHAVALMRREGGADVSELVMTFDDAAHLVRVSDGADGELVAVTWTNGVPTAGRVHGRDVAAGMASATPVADAVAWARGSGATPGVVVDLPLRMPPFWHKRLDAAKIGSDDWRHMARQQMATYAALQSPVELAKLYRELLDHGGVSVGDLVLASGSLVQMSDKERQVALAPFAATPVGRYVAATALYAMQAANPALGASGAAAHATPAIATPAANEPGAVAALWSLRQIAADAEDKRGDVALARLVAMGDRAPALRVIAAAVISARAPQGDPAKAAPLVRGAWDAIATGTRGNLGRAQAVWALYRVGHYAAAADELDRYVDKLDLAAPPAQMTQLAYVYQASGRGNAGWQIAWVKWRDRVLAAGNFEHVMSMLDVAATAPNDLQRVLTRAGELAGSDVDRVMIVATAAQRYGKTAWAQTLLEPFAQRTATRAVHQLLGGLAQGQGRTAEALVQYEAAQDAPGDDRVPVQQVRNELSTMIGLARDLAMQSTGPARDTAVARALKWGARWRQLDPGNASIDATLGDLELAVGNTAEAWRQLSSAIERDPMSGDGYQTVAAAFEAQGHVAEALPYWEQALRIDQTNPTPRLRKAEALAALGRRDDATAVLRDIAGRTWHERWAGVAAQAQALLEQARSRGE